MKISRKNISLAMALTMSSLSADTISDAFEDAKVSGEWRTFYIDRDRSGKIGDTQQDTNGLATGGHLKLETAPINGLSLGAGLYTTNPLSDNGKEREPSLFDDNKDGFTVLGEAYLKYLTDSGNSLTVGSMKINTPLAGADDVRMLPNFFRGALFVTPHIPDSTFMVGHFTDFMAGSFSNVYWGPKDTMNTDGSPTWKGLLVLSGGYGLNNDSGRFINMGKYAVNKETDGVTAVGFINNSVENLKVQAWDYVAYDILNALYLQADYKLKLNDSISSFISAQYINEMSIGDELGGEVESMFVGVKGGVKTQGVTLSGAFSTTGSSDDKLGAILAPWGGVPAFNQGMVSRHMFFEDTTAFKIVGSYDLNKHLQKNGSVTLYYASYDVGDKNNIQPKGWTATETGFDITCNPAVVKNLKVRFRGNFPTEFIETPDGKDLDWAEYRFIVSYKF